MKRSRAELEAGDGPAASPRGERKNVMRNLMLALDLSEGVNKRDFLPDRLAVMVEAVLMFVNKFFDACPLGHMGLVLTRELSAERPCRLQVGRENVVRGIKDKVIGSTGSGQGSVQNALQLCISELSAQPDVATREVLMVWASSSSSDPGDVMDMVRVAVERNVRINILGFGGKLFVLSKVASMTGGTYFVPKDEQHLQKLLLRHVDAPTTLASQKPSYILMGFPWAKPGGARGTGGRQSLACPRCGTPAADIPTLCSTCNITLLSSSHVARSYYSLFPPPTFAGAASPPAPAEAVRCDACNTAGEGLVRCTKCATAVCRDCHTFLRDKLRMCPGCE